MSCEGTGTGLATAGFSSVSRGDSSIRVSLVENQIDGQSRPPLVGGANHGEDEAVIVPRPGRVGLRAR